MGNGVRRLLGFRAALDKEGGPLALPPPWPRPDTNTYPNESRTYPFHRLTRDCPSAYSRASGFLRSMALGQSA